MDDFDEKSFELVFFIVLVYFFGYCFGFFIIVFFFEVYGWVCLYYVCNVFFVFWIVVCVLVFNINVFIVFCFFVGLVGSCFMIIGVGSIIDMIF